MTSDAQIIDQALSRGLVDRILAEEELREDYEDQPPLAGRIADRVLLPAFLAMISVLVILVASGGVWLCAKIWHSIINMLLT